MRYLILLALWFVYSATCSAFDPPRGLKWGMTYQEAKDTFPALGKLSREKLPKGYREYPELRTGGSNYRAEAKDLKLLDKKAKRTYLVFDSTMRLTQFQYIFLWDNDESNKGLRKSWVYHYDLALSLSQKYGPPSIDETKEERGKSISSGVGFRMIWEDTNKSIIILTITRQRHDAVIAVVDEYMVLLVYSPTAIDMMGQRDVNDDEL